MKRKLLVLALHLAATGTDAYFTNRNQHARYRTETDPIARPFVSRGQPMLITYFSAAFGIETAVEWELHRHGHDKIAAGVEAFNILDHATGAGMSAHGYRPRRANGK